MTGGPQSGDLLGRALTAARDLAYDWDLPGDGIDWMGAVDPVLGAAMARRLATGQGLSAQVHPDDRSERLLALARHLDKREPYDCVYRLANGVGGYRWVSDRGTAERNAVGRPIRMSGVLRPIDGFKLEEARLRRMAYRDDLTGLPNRRRLLHRLDRMLRTLIAAGRTGGLVVIGIDQLGMVNEVFGYPSGDAVLVEMGRRLLAEAGPQTEVARIAGDRFAVVLPGVGAAEAELACERLLRVLRAEPVETPGGDLRVTVSAGWLALPIQARTAGDALAKAESAMIEVKRAGRNAAQGYSPSRERRRAQRIDLAVVDLVERALSQQRVDLAFQPVVDSGTREVRHYEALLRVGDDYGGMLNAAAVVPAAESMGLMRRLDQAVLDMAIAELERHPGIALAVNVSAVNAGRGSWLDRAIERLAHQRALSNRLMVEITETVALIDPAETGRFVDTLHELGARVAIDDFGAGNPSFRALRRLGVDAVKIDGSFVVGIAGNPDNRLFVRALVGIARGFGLETVAEFVETEEDALVLRDEGVSQLQGYLFGRPERTRPWLVTAAEPVISSSG
jgi:diguanylate cyclase (GGDEF)-like protein